MVIGGLWPVVQRELCESARLPLTHWLRVSGALFGTLAIWNISRDAPISAIGVEIFTKLDVLLTCLILFLLPALTADSIARERREGTLGLLLLTPLTPSQIVIGKVVSRVLRVFVIWLGVVPILAVCFICGGVEPGDLSRLILIHVVCGMIALSAGLLASSFAKSRMPAFVLAFVLLGIFIQPFKPMLSSFTHMGSASNGLSGPQLQLLLSSSGPAGMQFRINNIMQRAGFLAPAPTAVGYSSFHPGIDALLFMNFLAALLLWVSIRFAGQRVKSHGKEVPPTKRQQEMAKRYCTPLLAGSFRRKMRRTLESNPISWLQQYSWKAGASKWGLCLLFACVATFAIGERDLSEYTPSMFVCLLLLIGAYTFAGVNGFHYDKSSGALELILVTPLSIGQIIFGRARGLWKQFLPSLVILLGFNFLIRWTVTSGDIFEVYRSWYYSRSGIYGGSGRWGLEVVDLATFASNNFLFINLEIIAIYVTLPIIATCFALSARKIFWAAALTAALAFAPLLIMYANESMDGWRHEYHGYRSLETEALLGALYLVTSPLVIVVAQIVATLKIYNRLAETLAARRYAF